MGLVERFREFFTATNGGNSPYPWQESLMESVAATGRWPAAIGAPTGSGKSSIVDVHVFLVAERERARRAQEDSIARPPRRLVLVAPRRVLVEDQYERALKLANLLTEPDGSVPILAELAGYLDDLHFESHEADETPASPLGVARLRGGVELDNSWRTDPSRCQVICATPQMWGSRLLMRGYRASRLSRNLETGLLAYDAVAVIDEAHLHDRLVETASRIASSEDGGCGLQLVAMSATREGDGSHSLTDADLDHEELSRRVLAGKPVEVVGVDDWSKCCDAEIAAQAEVLGRNREGTVGVFVNTVSSALEVAKSLGATAGSVAVVCGRMRPADLDRLREEHPGLLDARGNPDVDFLVSTQSLEVGADLDFVAMVSAIAPAPALAQRAGRLNRSGRHLDAVFKVVAPEGLTAADAGSFADAFLPYDAEEVIAGMQWLETLGGDASPHRVAASPMPESRRAPLPLLGSIDLETLSLTCTINVADPDVSLYIEEPRDRLVKEIGIAARDHLPVSVDGEVGDNENQLQAELLKAAPPRQHEVATLEAGSGLWPMLDRTPGSWLLRYEEGELEATPLSDHYRPRDGDVIVVPAGIPIVTQGVIGVGRGRSDWATEIDDVRERPPEGTIPDEIVRLEATDLEALPEGDPMLARRETRDELARLVKLQSTGAPKQLRRRLDATEVSWLPDATGEYGYLVVRPTKPEGSLPAASVAPERPVTIDDHQEEVALRVEGIVRRLDGLLDENEAESLKRAAALHDQGKRHPRFQRRMGARPDEPPLAKPAPDHRPDRGDGWRHEQLSAAFAWDHTAGDPLATAAVAAHHGHGRVLFDRDLEGALDGWDDCDPGARDALERLFGAFGIYEAERARLQRRIGVHRLAHFEALLRCADMQVSREGK